ncbi:PH domain-containing protein [Actinoplanes sp. CA-252034]|uniref:PH domain-containing protein n=1 Tax=Actinoplanes sp. CA-252034 TaxID=3239906 RepID=UPI003D97298B
MTKVWGLARFVVVYELRLWAALFRWILRRPIPVEPGTRRFGYIGAVKMILIAFIVVSAIEIPILELMIPWEPVANVLLFAGVYGLIWMIGLYATIVVHPHLVGESGLRIRNSLTLDVGIAWDRIAAIDVRRRSMPPGGQTQLEDGVLSLGMAGQTSIDVRLTEPLVLAVRKAKGQPASTVRFHADDPEALVEAAREFLAQAATKNR